MKTLYFGLHFDYFGPQLYGWLHKHMVKMEKQFCT